MPRSRASAKQAGSRFERLIADRFAEVVDDRIDRRVKTGSTDKGDVSSLRVHGQRVVIECKDYGGQVEIGNWLREAEAERVNDNALAGVVVAKRRSKSHPDNQYVMMTVADLLALITGTRP